MRDGFIAGHDDEGKRVDRVVRKLLGDVPLSAVFRALRTGSVRVNGRKPNPADRVQEGDSFVFRNLSCAALDAPPETKPSAPRSALDLASILLLETEDFLFINKPRGILTHGAGGLDEAVLAYLADTRNESLAFVPAPLHRLDRNTTGLIVASKTIRGARAFSYALASHSVSKHYLAVLRGRLDRQDHWVDSLERLTKERKSVRSSGSSRRKAITIVNPIATNGSLTLAEISILTGLTHQIRAQAAIRGRPLVGDSKYGGGSTAQGYILHAYRLDFPQDFDADAPERVLAPAPAAASAYLCKEFGPQIPLSAPTGVILP